MILDAATLEQVAAVDRILRGVEGLRAAGPAEDRALRLGLRDQHGRLHDVRRGRRGAAGAPARRGGGRRGRGARDRRSRHASVRAAGGAADRQGGALRDVRRLRRHLRPAPGRAGTARPRRHAERRRVLALPRGDPPWLPVVLALSANSPWFAGALTGMASNRAPVLARAAARRRRRRRSRRTASGSRGSSGSSRLGVAEDYTRIWWDVRPHPKLGTLEVRVARPADRRRAVRRRSRRCCRRCARRRSTAACRQRRDARRPRARRLRAEPLGGGALRASRRSCCIRTVTRFVPASELGAELLELVRLRRRALGGAERARPDRPGRLRGRPAAAAATVRPTRRRGPRRRRSANLSAWPRSPRRSRSAASAARSASCGSRRRSRAPTASSRRTRT